MYLQSKNWKIVNMQDLLDRLIVSPDWNYVIKKEVRNRTTDQNRYLRWCVYKTIADKIGEDVEYVHWVMGQKFLLDHTKKAPYVKSTTKLNTTEFTIYIDKIKNFVAQYGVIVPEANDFTTYIDEWNE